jgi:hypothetical protein
MFSANGFIYKMKFEYVNECFNEFTIFSSHNTETEVFILIFKIMPFTY